MPRLTPCGAAQAEQLRAPQQAEYRPNLLPVCAGAPASQYHRSRFSYGGLDPGVIVRAHRICNLPQLSRIRCPPPEQVHDH